MQKLLGQTLIETMVTLLFISVSVIALIRFQNYLSYDNSLSQQKSEATLLGQQKIEQLRDFQYLNDTSGYTSYQSIATGSQTTTGVNATYTLAWTVTSFTNPTYKNVDLTVSWTDRYNTAQSIRLTTRIAGIEPSLSATIF